ncbi:hypothetical protein BvCmsOUNP029_04085 [Escherichia coli]|nr:hypothetical protein BvCmsOUNP029_04085 [Escherichia coli]
MNQQVTHRYVSITQIRTEKCFTKILYKLVTYRMTTEKLAALMSRTIKRAVSLINVINQCFKEWRE